MPQLDRDLRVCRAESVPKREFLFWEGRKGEAVFLLLSGAVQLAKGFVDTFRVFNKDGGHYTWWSNFSRARERNIGWRIDYEVLSPGLKGSVQSAGIYKTQRFSDHAPLTLDFDL